MTEHPSLRRLAYFDVTESDKWAKECLECGHSGKTSVDADRASPDEFCFGFPCRPAWSTPCRRCKAIYSHDSPYHYYPREEFTTRCHSRGLAYLRQLVAATDYDESYNLSGSPQLSDNLYKLVHATMKLDHSRPDLALAMPYDADPLKIWYEYYYTSCVKDVSFFAEDDIGPAEAWKWAHANSTIWGWYIGVPRSQLQRSGYIMWDFSRISQWEWFHIPLHARYDHDHDDGVARIQRRDAWLASW